MYSILNHDHRDRHQRAILTEDQIRYANYLCQKYTGYNTIFEMAKNYPTLRVSNYCTKDKQTEMGHLRELYACVAGRPAFGTVGLTGDLLSKAFKEASRTKEVAK